MGDGSISPAIGEYAISSLQSKEVVQYNNANSIKIPRHHQLSNNPKKKKKTHIFNSFSSTQTIEVMSTMHHLPFSLAELTKATCPQLIAKPLQRLDRWSLIPKSDFGHSLLKQVPKYWLLLNWWWHGIFAELELFYWVGYCRVWLQERDCIFTHCKWYAPLGDRNHRQHVNLKVALVPHCLVQYKLKF